MYEFHELVEEKKNIVLSFSFLHFMYVSFLFTDME